MWLGGINQWATNYTGNLGLAVRVEEGGKTKELKLDTIEILLQGRDDLAVMLVGFQIACEKGRDTWQATPSQQLPGDTKSKRRACRMHMDLHLERHGNNHSSLVEKRIILR